MAKQRSMPRPLGRLPRRKVPRRRTAAPFIGGLDFTKARRPARRNPAPPRRRVQQQLARAHKGLRADRDRLARAAATAKTAGRDTAATKARQRVGIIKRCLQTVQRHQQRVRRGGEDAVDDATDALEEVQEARQPVTAIVRKASGRTTQRNPYGPLQGMRNWSAGEWLAVGAFGAVVYWLGNRGY